MSLAIKVYEVFKDDESKARVLSEVVDTLEQRIVPVEDIARKGDLEVTTLTLKKDIEQVRKELKEVELTLKKDIEEVRLTLQKEIEQVKSGIIKWISGLLLVQTGVIVTIVTLIR